MAKQIIILETNPADGGFTSVRCALWFPVTAGQEVPIPGLTKSAWTGASAQEIADLQNGVMVEEVKVYSYPSGFTNAQIKGELVAAYQARAAYLASVPFQGRFYGIFYNGTAWSQ